jgi:hypothetical protein
MVLDFQWGHGDHVVKAADVDDRHCPVCQDVRHFEIDIHYRHDYVYFLFGAVTQLKFFLVCQSCRSQFQIREEEARTYVRSLPIPIWHRYGCLIGTILFGCMMALMLFTINR